MPRLMSIGRGPIGLECRKTSSLICNAETSNTKPALTWRAKYCDVSCEASGCNRATRCAAALVDPGTPYATPRANPVEGCPLCCADTRAFGGDCGSTDGPLPCRCLVAELNSSRDELA